MSVHRFMTLRLGVLSEVTHTPVTCCLCWRRDQK